MDVAISVLITLFLIFNISFSLLDFNHNNSMKESLFEATRAANQNALYEVQGEFDNYEEITTAEMLEKWLINFCNNNSLHYDDIELSFIQIETDPVPLFLVYVEGYKDSYFIFKNKDAKALLVSGAMILPDSETE